MLKRKKESHHQQKQPRNKHGRFLKQTWDHLLSNKIGEDVKSSIRCDVHDLDEKGHRLANILDNRKLMMNHIINSSNYSESKDGRTRTFLAVTMEEFQNRDYVATRWSKLGGLAVIECIKNTHYHSVFIQPGKTREPIIGYDSRRVYSHSSRTDLSGKACTDLNNDGWKQQVQLREQKSLAGLIDFMGRVATRADEIVEGRPGISRFKDRSWKVLRSFVSQTDDKSCGVLTCLFLECMKCGIDISTAETDVDPKSLEEYRWRIADKCCKYTKEGNTIYRDVELIKLE